ncbi:hypothetical protein C8A05DRAFT_47731 [Staphylotrichum tortipilum]|uniref:Uncharacterized protein n=1 Tax=Staphylotrichum tortipilum TaxID=2831512 RepID=A0AAN6MCZ6_9PEZI|nr:hypothetical protein C8A05DRAFT_47731 [Staphylotrichum longicolle]
MASPQARGRQSEGICTGDYVQFKRDTTTIRFGRVDHIFVFDNFNDRHIFLVLTPIKRTGTRHHILDLEVMEEEEEQAVIIGVPAVCPTRLYMVPVQGVGTVWVDWDVHLL